MTEATKQEAVRQASRIFDRQADWVTFYREVMGKDGLLRRLFPKPSDLANFEQTEEYANILAMLAQLRTQGKEPPKETTRVITVRLPASLHEGLEAEAHDHHVSVNQLCISKLLQVVDDQLIQPKQRTRQDKKKQDQPADETGQSQPEQDQPQQPIAG